MFVTIYLYKNLMKLPRRNPRKPFLSTGMAFRPPDAIALQKMTVLGTRLYVPQQECVLHRKKEIKFWLRCKLDFQTWVTLCGLKILNAIENIVIVNKIADSLSKFKTFLTCMVYHSAPICTCKIRIHKKWYSRVSITCQKHW